METINPKRLERVVGGKGSSGGGGAGGKLPTVEAQSNINELLQSMHRSK
jgi:hypothetical protein